MSKSKKQKEFYLFDDIQTGSFVMKNNVTYFINGFTEEDVKDIKTIYVSVSVSGTLMIRGKEKKPVGVLFNEKLLKIIFDTENKSIEVVGRKKDGTCVTTSEIYDEKDFVEMYETIPVLLKEQDVHKFTKRKNGNRLTLYFK